MVATVSLTTVVVATVLLTVQVGRLLLLQAGYDGLNICRQHGKHAWYSINGEWDRWRLNSGVCEYGGA